MSGWEFWIDVGGTFTDCLGRRPDGKLRRHKTLSSGVVKGAIGPGSDRSAVIDPARCHDPPEFWRGWELRTWSLTGEVEAARTIRSFSPATGRLELTQPLESFPQPGQVYELGCGLEAPLVAIRYLLACPLGEPLPPLRIRLGTTRGTNALLTRRGAAVAWVTTAGFEDLLRIGYQARPELFQLQVQKPAPLFRAVLAIDERLAADGRVLRSPQEAVVRAGLEDLRGRGIEALAIGLLHAYLNPEHERWVARLAEEVGFREISLSSQVAPVIKLVARGDTTVVNAYLNPVLRDYLERLESELHGSTAADLRIMTSAGGLVVAPEFQGKDSILSGPAGGVVGCAGVARAAGFEHAIGFDMGGTSTDVTRFDGRYDYEFETEKAGVRIVAPMLAIETVAAGGGSVCHFDGVKLAVGPDSAGADPGPACYGRGGPLTVTDLNLYLGRLSIQAFPFPLDRAAVERRLETLCQSIQAQDGSALTRVQLAEGFLRIANANMAQAIRSISIAKGYDPRDYVLVAFGGAAPQHACGVARELNLRRILDHPDGSLLSALGMGLADVTRHVQRGIYRPLAEVRQALPAIFDELESAARQAVLREGIDATRIALERQIELRYLGTEWPLQLDAGGGESSFRDYVRRFAEEHRRLYGYAQRARPLEVVAARVAAHGKCGWSLSDSVTVPPRPRPVETTCEFIHRSQSLTAATYHRHDLRPGDLIAGPALVMHENSTTVIDPGWEGVVLSGGELLLTDQSCLPPRELDAQRDPITLEIFHGHFESIARQMGIALRNTSSSVNVKERLDYSCAIFTGSGDLVVNAPHIPVHLGAMSQTVKYVLADHPDLRPGDVVITNDPFRGGSHLPDVTVVTPVFDPTGQELRFLTASRAHHAELGGIAPGSMPPGSRNLAEEGVLIRSFKLIDQGVARWDRLQARLAEPPYPSRAIEANLADVNAQIAANQQGVRDLQQLEARYGWPVVAAYMNHIQDAAEEKMRAAFTRIPDGTYRFQDHLDNGAVIQVEIEVQQDRAVIDFAGSAEVQSNNLNANLAIVTAAVMYCLRCLIDEPIPLNQGVLGPVELRVPVGILNPPPGPDPAHCPAVAGGNVETSQRIVDVLLGAFGAAAASQGTMNNLLFGNGQFGYYETICGGVGATPSGAGADAVHTHMTNTRLTDPEVLESKYPLRVREFRIREGSGGLGKHRGGAGVVRQLEFLDELELSLISQRRGPYPPYGLAGGRAGQLGENRLQRADGREERLAGCAHTQVQAGDILTIRTPGGGGFGRLLEDLPENTPAT